jgi:hypothetical protein
LRGPLPDRRATLKAIATACFWGLPALISVRMFFEMVFCEEPFFRGMSCSLSNDLVRHVAQAIGVWCFQSKSLDGSENVEGQ